jgi:hypothetical protein
MEPKKAHGPHPISSQAPTGNAGRFGFVDIRPALANQSPAVWPTKDRPTPLPPSPMNRLKRLRPRANQRCVVALREANPDEWLSVWSEPGPAGHDSQRPRKVFLRALARGLV